MICTRPCSREVHDLKKRIGIDGRAMENNRTGTGRYVYELCKRLGKLLPTYEFYVFSRTPIDPPVSADNWHYIVEHHKYLANLKSVLWLKTRGRYLAKKFSLDVYWATTTFYPRLKNAKIICTVHDVTYRIAPQSMKLAMLISNYLFFKRDLLQANMLVAVSKGTANRVQNLFKRIVDDVISPCADEMFKPMPIAEARKLLVRFAAPEKFVLGVATLEPRKNLPLLIEAFNASGLAEAGVELLLAGNIGWKSASIMESIEKHKIYGVKFLGFVSDEELVALYSTCSVFAFPSIYEGFGMPVREAISCGAKVVATDLPETREAGGTDVSYIPPDKDALAQALQNLMGAEVVQDENPAFQGWDESAEKMAKLFTC